MHNILEVIKKELLENQEIVDFCNKNKIKDSIFDDNLMVINQYKDIKEVCNNCLGKKSCEIDTYNMQPFLKYQNDRVTLNYHHCPHLDLINEDMLEMLFFPQNYFDGDLELTPKRKEVYGLINKFCKKPKSGRGMYIYGQFGTGKTFILLKMAKELTKKNVKVVFTYYPDLVRYIKNSIGSVEVERIINQLKRVDVLILDDVGGENNSPYIRDEVLGAILQYRMLASKPVFMSSNYDIERLKIHFKETSNTSDPISGERIVDRITYMMDVIELKDKNYRLN